MAAKDPSFESILEVKPTLHELCEHVRLGTKWQLFGVLLKLDEKRLDAIAEMNNDIENKAMKMFQLWLDINNNATRREVIKTLRKEAIGEAKVAENYEKVLREQNDDTKKKQKKMCQALINSFEKEAHDGTCTNSTKNINGSKNGTPIDNVSPACGKAIPLCLPNDCEWDRESNTYRKNTSTKRDSLVIVPEAKKILEEITNPISVIAIAGPCRTGKSYILSQLIPSTGHGEPRFRLGHTMDPETVGIWMWDTPFQHTLETREEVTVIILDTEGVDAVKAGSRGDTQIFTLSVLLSSSLIYNSMQVPRRDDLNKMTFITNLSKSIGRRGFEKLNEQEIRQIAPSFLWLLRDATLKPVNSEGKPCHFQDYLLEKVLQPNADAPLDDIQSQASKCLRTFFDPFDAEMVPSPSTDSDVTENIEDPNYTEKINPKFKQQVQYVRDKILRNCQPKKGYTEGSKMNGKQFAELLDIFVDDLNSQEGIPMVGSAWDQVMMNMYRTATERGIEKYEEVMNCLCFPIEEDDLQVHHIEAFETSVELFKQLTKLDSDRDAFTKHLEKLTGTIATLSNDGSVCISGLLYQYCKENEQESRKHCQEFLANLRVKHLNPILENLSHETTDEEIVTIIEEIKQSYFQQSKGPAQEDEFQKFMENFEEEKKGIISMISQLKTTNDQLQDLTRQNEEFEAIQKAAKQLQAHMPELSLSLKMKMTPENFTHFMDTMKSMQSQNKDGSMLETSVKPEST